MIIDAVLLNNELDMMEFRLQLYWNVVDKFVIVESDRTFSGLSKPYNFERNLSRFSWAMEKIIYHKIFPDVSKLDMASKPQSYDPTHDCWKLERGQREAILDACIDLPGDSTLIMGDADEFPALEAIRWVKDNEVREPLTCKQYFFYYNLGNLRLEEWAGSMFVNLNDARKIGTQQLRDIRGSFVSRGSFNGWHLSWFGDVKEKIEAFSHQEYNTPEFTDIDHITHCRTTGMDLFKRGTQNVKVDPKTFFPDYFVNIAKHYPWGIS